MMRPRGRAVGRLIVRLARAAAASALVGVAGSAVVGRAEAQVRQTGSVQILRAECVECHPRAHASVLGRGAKASGKCGTCHAAVHDTILTLYAGTAGQARVRPDPMFVARVGCGECHDATTLAPVSDRARLAAIDHMCTTCHGPTFAGMATRWSTGLAWRTRAVADYVNRASGRARVAGARRTLDLLRRAGAAHNVRAADALLRSTLDSVVAAYRAAGAPAPDRPELGPDPTRASCMGCHYGIEAARDSIAGRLFDHGVHVLRGALSCKECHSAADYLRPGTHDVDTRHGRTMITGASCDACHHAPGATAGCVTCHADDARLGRGSRLEMPLHLTPEASPGSRQVTFEHVDHPDVACGNCHNSTADVRQVAACASCHESHHRDAVGCAKCHGTDLRGAHKAADHLACVQCHARRTVALLTPDRSFCLACHADRVDHKGGRECAPCHMQRTPAELRRRMLAAPR